MQAPLTVVSLLLVTLFGHSAAAGCVSTATCLREIEEAHRETQTLTARFVQTKHLSLLDEPLVSTGRFTFKHPGRMLWQIETPRRTRILISGEHFHVPDLSEEDRRTIANTPLPSLLGRLGAIFSGDVQSVEESFVVTAQQAETAIQVHLRPRRRELQQTIQTMEVRFRRPQLLIELIRIQNALGDVLEIELREARRNEEVPDSLFQIGGVEPLG